MADGGTIFLDEVGDEQARPAGFEFSEQLIQRYSIGRPRLDVYKGGLSGIQLRRALEYIEECLGLDLTGKTIAAIVQWPLRCLP
jgi:hypothetical protein